MLNILLQAEAAAGPLGEYGSLIMFGLLFVVFYFFMIRPQTKKQKEIKRFRDSITKGDKVITTGGIYGKIREVKDITVILEISDNVKVTVDKGSVYASAADSASEAK